MNIVCVICSDLLVPSDDVFHTPCGHIFHYGCLLQWLEGTSKTCPQCRERTTESKIHKIYFNFSNDNNLEKDATSLQNELDNKNFQLKLKETVINNLTETKKELEKQTSGLRQEVRNLERELNGKDTALRALQSQIKFFKRQCVEMDEYKTNCKQLEEKVQNLQNVQVLLKGSESEVDEMITRIPDHTKLVTYIGVLKREMRVSFDKRRKLELRIRSLDQQLMESKKKYKVLEEEHTKQKELEIQLNICSAEKVLIQNQLFDKQASCVCNRSVENQNNLRSDFEKSEKTFGKEDIIEPTKLQNSSNPKEDDSCIIIDPGNNENTPQNMKAEGFFSLKTCGNGALKRNYANVKIPSILQKKSKCSPNQKTIHDDGMTYNGLGGRARIEEEFPIPKRRSSFSSLNSYAQKIKMERKRKKLKFDVGDNQKKLNLLINN